MRLLKRLLAFAVTMFAAFGLALAALTVTEQDGAAASVERTEVPSMRRSYREASDVVLATCEKSYVSSGGNAVSVFTVDIVYDGELEAGQTVTVCASAAEGGSYLLYLKRNGGADYAEDEERYASVTDELIPVRDGYAELGGAYFTLESIIEDLETQRGVLTVPAQCYYYEDTDSLFGACDDMILCRVTEVSGSVPTLCRSEEKGESATVTIDCTFVTVRVENSFGGEHSYGEKLTIALLPAHARSVINATDLAAVSDMPAPAAPSVGQEYIFFLLRSEDAKSSVHFFVNPYQGSVRLVDPDLVRCPGNAALKDIATLREFADALNKYRGFGV